MVGFLIWGYLILTLNLILGGILILGAAFLITNFADFILNRILLKYIIPFFALFAFDFIIEKIVNVIFLASNTKMLGFNNFRAYNIFLFFRFFLDLFMGMMTCVFRIIKGAFVSGFMMPSMIVFLFKNKLIVYFYSFYFKI